MVMMFVVAILSDQFMVLVVGSVFATIVLLQFLRYWSLHISVRGAI